MASMPAPRGHLGNKQGDRSDRSDLEVMVGRHVHIQVSRSSRSESGPRLHHYADVGEALGMNPYLGLTSPTPTAEASMLHCPLRGFAANDQSVVSRRSDAGVDKQQCQGASDLVRTMNGLWWRMMKTRTKTSMRRGPKRSTCRSALESWATKGHTMWRKNHEKWLEKGHKDCCFWYKLRCPLQGFAANNQPDGRFWYKFSAGSCRGERA